MLRAASPLEDARRARALLGPGKWARVIRVENAAVRSAYPREVFALVFELGGILWFYTDADGTQSFSLHRNNLAAEKADFGPLLRDIEPGFARYEVLPAVMDDSGTAARRGEDLPNGCFVESYAALRERVARGELIVRAQLLSYYVDLGGRRLGHTVLTYETPGGAFVLDPLASSKRARRVGRRLTGDALELAQVLRPDLTVARAVWVPAALPAAASLLAVRDGAAEKEMARMVQ